MSKSRKDILSAAANLPDQSPVVLTKHEKSSFGLDCSDEKPYVVLKYYQPKFECFSDWQKDELKFFSDFVEILRSARWSDIYKSGGQLGHKTGLGYTKHKDLSKLPQHSELNINPDITFFELRVTNY